MELTDGVIRLCRGRCVASKDKIANCNHGPRENSTGIGSAWIGSLREAREKVVIREGVGFIPKFKAQFMLRRAKSEGATRFAYVKIIAVYFIYARILVNLYTGNFSSHLNELRST